MEQKWVLNNQLSSSLFNSINDIKGHSNNQNQRQISHITCFELVTLELLNVKVPLSFLGDTDFFVSCNEFSVDIGSDNVGVDIVGYNDDYCAIIDSKSVHTLLLSIK